VILNQLLFLLLKQSRGGLVLPLLNLNGINIKKGEKMKTIPIFSEEEIAQFNDELDKIDGFLPIAEKVVDKILLSGPILSRIVRSISDGIVKNRAESIDLYTKLNFSREEAIQMTLSDISSIRRATTQWNQSFESYNKSQKEKGDTKKFNGLISLLDKSNSRDIDNLLSAVNKLAEVAKKVIDR